MGKDGYVRKMELFRYGVAWQLYRCCDYSRSPVKKGFKNASLRFASVNNSWQNVIEVNVKQRAQPLLA